MGWQILLFGIIVIWFIVSVGSFWVVAGNYWGRRIIEALVIITAIAVLTLAYYGHKTQCPNVGEGYVKCYNFWD